MNCAICDNIDTDIIGKINGYDGDMIYCKACNTFFPSRFPADEEIMFFYQGFSYNCKELTETLRNLFIRKCEKISKLIAPWQTGKRLLDFGGGGGLYSKGFQDLGYDVSMTEIDSEAIEHAKALGISVHSLKEDIGKFDIVFSSHVIEHYKNQHDFFRIIDGYIKQKGILIVATPNKESREFYRTDHVARYKNLIPGKTLMDFIKNPWWCFAPPRHFYALSSKSVETLAKKHGYRVLTAFSEYSTRCNFLHNDMYDFKMSEINQFKQFTYKAYINLCSFLASLFDKRHGDNLVVILQKKVSHE